MHHGFFRLLLLEHLLILPDLPLIAPEIMSGFDLDSGRLVFAAVMHAGIIGRQLLRQHGVRDGRGREQYLRIGMQRVQEELLRLRQLHNAALVNDADAVGKEAHNGQVRAMNR